MQDEKLQRSLRRTMSMQRTLEALRTELRRQLSRSKALGLDLEVAASVHRSLLPEQVRDDRIHVDVRYCPIEQVGGDYCQVRFADPNTCYITMCDVMGHGVQAALLATRVSSEVRHWILECRAPCEIVQMLNKFIFDHFAETNLFLSFIAARIDLPDRLITWSGAGHPSPLLLRGDGTTVEHLTSQNLLIGIRENCLDSEPAHSILAEPGDRLLLYTDGLTETTDAIGSKQLGTDGLSDLATVAMCADLFDMADHIFEQIAHHYDGPVTDDRTLIVAELK